MEPKSSTSQTASWWLESPSISHHRLQSPVQSRDSDAVFHEWSGKLRIGCDDPAVAEEESEEFAAFQELHHGQDDAESLERVQQDQPSQYMHSTIATYC